MKSRRMVSGRYPEHVNGKRIPMQITRSSLETQKGPANWFCGDVYIAPCRAGRGRSA